MIITNEDIKTLRLANKLNQNLHIKKDTEVLKTLSSGKDIMGIFSFPKLSKKFDLRLFNISQIINFINDCKKENRSEIFDIRVKENEFIIEGIKTRIKKIIPQCKDELISSYPSKDIVFSKKEIHSFPLEKRTLREIKRMSYCNSNIVQIKRKLNSNEIFVDVFDHGKFLQNQKFYFYGVYPDDPKTYEDMKIKIFSHKLNSIDLDDYRCEVYELGITYVLKLTSNNFNKTYIVATDPKVQPNSDEMENHISDKMAKYIQTKYVKKND